MTDTLDTLAGLKIRAGRGEPVRWKLDGEGIGVLVSLPDPEYLARVLEPLPGDLRRAGSRIVSADGSPAPEGWTVQEVAERLVESWRTLPDREDAAEVYRDLRIVSTVSPARASDYALQVVRKARDLLEPAPRAPRRSRGERTPDVERKRRSREQQRRDEDDSARWWLDGYLSGWGDDEEAPAPGTEVLGSVLYGMARERLEEIVEEYAEDVTAPRTGSPAWFLGLAERLEEWAARAESEGLPLRPRVPGSKRFYSLADEVLGRHRPGRSRTKVYTVPDTRGGAMSLYSDEEIRTALEVREIVARLREQADRLEARPAATGTDGKVVPIRRGGLS